MCNAMKTELSTLYIQVAQCTSYVQQYNTVVLVHDNLYLWAMTSPERKYLLNMY